jgi:hypothetical protein
MMFQNVHEYAVLYPDAVREPARYCARFLAMTVKSWSAVHLIGKHYRRHIMCWLRAAPFEAWMLERPV